MASLTLLSVPSLLIPFLLFFVVADARPGIHFHPCNTIIISYSFSALPRPILDTKPNPNFLRLFTFFSNFDDTRPSTFFLPFLSDHRSIHHHKSNPIPNSSPSVVTSLRHRTKDIISVVIALLFGVGCGFLTAATMYLAWSIVSSRYYDSYDQEDDYHFYYEDVSPGKDGRVMVPDVDFVDAPAAAKSAI